MSYQCFLKYKPNSCALLFVVLLSEDSFTEKLSLITFTDSNQRIQRSHRSMSVQLSLPPFIHLHFKALLLKNETKAMTSIKQLVTHHENSKCTEFRIPNSLIMETYCLSSPARACKLQIDPQKSIAIFKQKIYIYSN